MNLFDQDPVPFLDDGNAAAAPEDNENGLPLRPWRDLLEIRQRFNPEDTSPENNFGRFAVGGRLQEYSNGIQVADVAQVLFQENPARRYMIIIDLGATNPDTGALIVETLWIRPGGLERPAVAGNGIPLNPPPAAGQGGGAFVMESTAIDTSAWTIVAHTTNHRFIAYEL